MRDYDLHLAQQTEQLQGGILSRLWQNWKARRRVVRLLDLDDHLLYDIGVERADLESASRVPVWENASVRLTQLHVRNLDRMVVMPPPRMQSHFSAIRPA